MSARPIRSERHAALEANWPACTQDACNEGRSKCPVPDACRLPERMDEDGAALLRYLVAAVAIVFGVLIALHFYLRMS